MPTFGWLIGRATKLNKWANEHPQEALASYRFRRALEGDTSAITSIVELKDYLGAYFANFLPMEVLPMDQWMDGGLKLGSFEVRLSVDKGEAVVYFRVRGKK